MTNQQEQQSGTGMVLAIVDMPFDTIAYRQTNDGPGKIEGR